MEYQPKPGLDATKSIRRSLVAGSVGVFVHWFDWAVYAYLANTLAEVFFPERGGVTGLLAVFGILAISFAVRPIGAFIFGYLGDRLGRKQTLSIVILLMAAGSLLLGILPDYETAGVLAPLLLIFARTLQGLAAGGEFGSAAAFLAEFSPPKKRGYGVSWLEVGSLLGFLAASLLVYILSVSISPEAMIAWGWRIAFLISAPMGLVGYYIRTKIEDTPEFTEISKQGEISENPIREAITLNWKEIIQAGGLETMMNVTFYIVLVYLLSYQESVLGWTASHAALVSVIASIVAAITIPIFGHLSDRWGRKPIIAVSALGLILLSYPLFMLMQAESMLAGTLSTVGLGVILATILSVHAVTGAELFPTRTRQTGLSISYNVTAALFAGTVPYVLTWLIAATGNIMLPALYLMLMGIVGIAVLLTIKETRGVDLLEKDHQQPAGASDKARNATAIA